MNDRPIHYGRLTPTCPTRGAGLVLTTNKAAVTCKRCRSMIPSMKRADERHEGYGEPTSGIEMEPMGGDL